MELVKFIKSEPHWENLLQFKPYCLKISRDNGYIIFKYNQVDSDFSIPLVREARGCILRESDMKVVCRAFDKFGNYGESYAPELDWNSSLVMEKVDGSLMKVWYDKEWHISTNGTINAFKAPFNDMMFDSFGSAFESAVWESSGLLMSDFYKLLDPRLTYMFELVSPYNRIVIPYNKTELYFLGARDSETGEEYLCNFSEELMAHFKIPKIYPMSSLEEVLNAAGALPWDEEGYVCLDKNFNRLKIKSPQYVMAHYCRNNNVITLRHLIEVILTGEEEEFKIYCSDRINELKSVSERMDQLRALFEDAKKDFLLQKPSFSSRREAADFVGQYESFIRPYLFMNIEIDTSWEQFVSKKSLYWWEDLISKI